MWDKLVFGNSEQKSAGRLGPEGPKVQAKEDFLRVAGPQCTQFQVSVKIADV